MPSAKKTSSNLGESLRVKKDAGALLSGLDGISALLTCVAGAAEAGTVDMPTIAEALYVISDLHHVAKRTFQENFHD